MTSATSQLPSSNPSDVLPDGDLPQTPQAQAGEAACAIGEVPHNPPLQPAGDATMSTTPDYERLKALAALYDHPPQRARRRLQRAILMLTTFVVGASAGLAATWWATGAGRDPAAVAVARPLQHASSAPAGQPVTDPRSGISASELPYDGRHAPSTSPSSVPATSPEELPEDGMPAAGQARLGEIDPARAAHPKKAVPAGAGKSVKAYRSGIRSMKDREIERIRQQADDELKKKPERRRPASEARTRSRQSSAHAAAGRAARHEPHDAARTQARLAKCNRAGNLIRREQCKWRLCAGMWGRNGCPSYAHAAPY